jgi:hypothetical protein
MGAWAIFKVIAEKKKQQVEGFLGRETSPKPADEALPFNMFVGSSIVVSEIPFTLCGDQLAVKQPAGENIVHAFSKTPINSSILYRFYVGIGSDGEHMIQIVTDRKGAVEECRLFRTHAEVFPESREEWDFWLDEKEGYIGLNQFQDKDGTLFKRLWCGSEDLRVAPVRFTEKINLDRYGRDFVTVAHQAMLYGRVVIEEQNLTVNEYMLLSFESHGDRDHKIHIMGGIDLEKSYLSVNGRVVG